MAAEVSAAQMVSSLQKRVRSKLRKHAGAAGGADGKGKAVDAKRVQWLAIQSRARKITPEQFEVLAKERARQAEEAKLLVAMERLQATEEDPRYQGADAARRGEAATLGGDVAGVRNAQATFHAWQGAVVT